MGIFSRNKDETEEYIEEQPAVHPVAAPMAPSVDGVLPPGVPPAPAPAGNNLASQTTPPSVPANLPTPSPAIDDSAGDYIMTAPPMNAGGQADEWSEPSQPTQPAHIQSVPVNVEPEHSIEPAYAEMAQPADTPSDPAADVQPETPEQEPAKDLPEPETQETPQVSEPVMPEEPADTSEPSGDLADIKQQALSSLSPLVGHLNQSPEEKFHTTMMLLQSTDDQSLIKTAYEAAQAISDDKTRAQALLDIVNEINYFTQKSS